MEGAQVHALVTLHNPSSPTPPFHFLPFHDFQALPKDLFFKETLLLFADFSMFLFFMSYLLVVYFLLNDCEME